MAIILAGHHGHTLTGNADGIRLAIAIEFCRTAIGGSCKTLTVVAMLARQAIAPVFTIGYFLVETNAIRANAAGGTIPVGVGNRARPYAACTMTILTDVANAALAGQIAQTFLIDNQVAIAGKPEQTCSEK